MIRFALALAGSFVSASVAQASISIPTVPVRFAGNAPDPLTGSLYGSVGYEYRIGTTEVTNAQYAVFLNAKAASDTFDLYHTDMAGSFGGITRSGASGGYVYATIAGRESHPVNFVSFWDACRFANWLHNGQGSGDTETGAYTLTFAGIITNTITRNPGWQWAVTSEDEWYKAAYHQPNSAGGDSDNYWLYPTFGNSLPTTANANYDYVIGNTTPAGSYAANYYRTFDMGGNVWEWTEAIPVVGDRGLRGGSFFSGDTLLRASVRLNDGPTFAYSTLGFRVSRTPFPTICTTDFDQSNIIDVADLFAFLDAWFAQVGQIGSGLSADFFPNNEVTTTDLFLFLDAWFAQVGVCS